MLFSFSSFGHKNITAKHKNTIEFTKDTNLTLRGDCIVGVDSDFDLDKIRDFICFIENNGKRVKVIIKAGSLREEINCEINTEFNDDKEIVLRRGDFASKRTFGINADKACIDLDNGFIEKLKNPNQKIEISITSI